MRDEIYCGGLISDDYLEHYGKGHDDNPPGRGSGRYPFGSGKDSKKSTNKKEADVANPNKPNGDINAFRKAYDNESYMHENSKNLKEIKEIASDPAVRKARDEMLKADSEYQKYEKLMEDEWWAFYAHMAADVNYELLDKKTRDGISKADFRDWYRFDDGDQGDYNSFTCYLISHNIDPNKYEERLYETLKKYQNEVKEASRKVYGDQIDESYREGTIGTLGGRIYDAVLQANKDEDEKAGYENPFGGYFMDPGISAEGMKNYQKALKIIDQHNRPFTWFLPKKDSANHSDVSDEELSHSSGSLFFKKNERSVDRRLAKRPLSRKR